MRILRDLPARHAREPGGAGGKSLRENLAIRALGLVHDHEFSRAGVLYGREEVGVESFGGKYRQLVKFCLFCRRSLCSWD